MRKKLKLSELMDGQGARYQRARSSRATGGYAQRNIARALSAPRKRHAHRLVNALATSVQNGQGNSFRMKL